MNSIFSNKVGEKITEGRRERLPLLQHGSYAKTSRDLSRSGEQLVALFQTSLPQCALRGGASVVSVSGELCWPDVRLVGGLESTCCVVTLFILGSAKAESRSFKHAHFRNRGNFFLP
jgi:hypothetical protein